MIKRDEDNHAKHNRILKLNLFKADADSQAESTKQTPQTFSNSKHNLSTSYETRVISPINPSNEVLYTGLSRLNSKSYQKPVKRTYNHQRIGENHSDINLRFVLSCSAQEGQLFRESMLKDNQISRLSIGKDVPLDKKSRAIGRVSGMNKSRFYESGNQDQLLMMNESSSSSRSKKKELETKNMDFQKIKSEMLEYLKVKLMNNPFFSIREHDMDKKAIQRELAYQKENIAIKNRESYIISNKSKILVTLKFDELFEILQTGQADRYEYIRMAICMNEDEAEITDLVKLVIRNLKWIFGLELGNDLMQELIPKNLLFQTRLIEFCSKHMCWLLKDEMKTKTIYRLAKISKEFRIQIFGWCAVNFEDVITEKSSVFLLISIFKISQSVEEFEPLRHTLRSRVFPSDLYRCKNYKRFLITYCEYCVKEELDRLAHEMKVVKNMLIWLNDKYESLTLSSFIRREHADICTEFMGLLENKIEALFKTKFFKSVFFRLSKAPTPFKISREMNRAILSVPARNIDRIMRFKEEFLFYISLVIMTMQPIDYEHLKQISSSRDAQMDLQSAVKSLIASFNKTKYDNMRIEHR